MEIPVKDHVQEIQLEAALGFNGLVPEGLCSTPCGRYVLLPLGSSIILKDSKTKNQLFLEGHTGTVSALRLSRKGDLLATGEESVGARESKTAVIVWDLERAKRLLDKGIQRSDEQLILHIMLQHIGKVQAVDFTYDASYLITMGGRIDSSIVVWDMRTGVSVCASPTGGSDTALCLRTLTGRADRFITAGDFHLRVWEFAAQEKRIDAMNAKLGALKRIIQTVDVAKDDTYAFAGTTTGEVLKIKIDRDHIKESNEPDRIFPTLQAWSKDRLGMGVKSVLALTDHKGSPYVLAGAGNGTVALMSTALTKVTKRVQLLGGVTSLCHANDGHCGFYAGTNQSSWYHVGPDLKTELRGTCHYGPVNDIIFPRGCPDLFVTCSANDVRVWNAYLRQEILRIQVPSLTCTCLAISMSGNLIITGWSDGKVRAFLPQSGKLAWVIPDAQPDGVTSLALCHDDDTRPPWRVISGGVDGRIRVWDIHTAFQKMAGNLKEHRKEVTSLAVTLDNLSFVSSSADGSCIVWDLRKLVRISAVMAQTLFQSAIFHPDGSQILTCGSDKKLTYWDVYDGGNPIREVVGGEESVVALDVRNEGDLFVSGGVDRSLRLWSWDDGVVLGVGKGHAGAIHRVRISPDYKMIVSTGEDGSIYLWTMPPSLVAPPPPSPPSSPQRHASRHEQQQKAGGGERRNSGVPRLPSLTTQSLYSSSSLACNNNSSISSSCSRGRPLLQSSSFQSSARSGSSNGSVVARGEVVSREGGGKGAAAAAASSPLPPRAVGGRNSSSVSRGKPGAVGLVGGRSVSNGVVNAARGGGGNRNGVGPTVAAGRLTISSDSSPRVGVRNGSYTSSLGGTSSSRQHHELSPGMKAIARDFQKLGR